MTMRPKMFRTHLVFRSVQVVCLLSGVVLTSIALSAQIHGVPASATSLGPQGFTSFRPGIPASATSLGPNGFTPEFNRPEFFRPSRRVRFDRDNRFDRLGHRLGTGTFFPITYAVPFFVTPYDDTVVSMPGSAMANDQSLGNQAPAKLEITIVDRREPAAPVATASAASLAPVAPSPAASQSAQIAELTPKVLVLRDGTRKEIRNYAILGNDLFDLSEGRTRRIPLASIDSDATSKANDELGLDFKLP